MGPLLADSLDKPFPSHMLGLFPEPVSDFDRVWQELKLDSKKRAVRPAMPHSSPANLSPASVGAWLSCLLSQQLRHRLVPARERVSILLVLAPGLDVNDDLGEGGKLVE